MHTAFSARRSFIFAHTFFRLTKETKTMANPTKTVIGKMNKNSDATKMSATPVPRKVTIYEIITKIVRTSLKRRKYFIIRAKNEWIAELFSIKDNQPTNECSPNAFAVWYRSFNAFLKLSLFIMAFLQNFKITPYRFFASPRKCA